MEIATLLLRMDPDQALQFDYNGYTPLHLAAIEGSVSILQEFASVAPSSFQLQSKHGENVLHLTIRYNKFEAFKFIYGFLKRTHLYQPDKSGNTVKHLADKEGFHTVRTTLIHLIVLLQFFYEMKIQPLYFMTLISLMFFAVCRVHQQGNTRAK